MDEKKFHTTKKFFQIDRVPLSVICSSASDKITERLPNRLLRPIFINGVEVGFAYATICSNLNLHDNQSETDIFLFHSKLTLFFFVRKFEKFLRT